MTILDAVPDDHDEPARPAPVAAAGGTQAPPPAWPVPVLPIEYERAVQPTESRILWESHPDGETFIDPFSPWKTLSALAQWAFLLGLSLLHVALFRFQISRGIPTGWFMPSAQCVLTGWVLFRIACDLRGWGQPVVVSVRSGVLSLTRPTLGGMRQWQWPAAKVKGIDVAVGSSTQHALRSLRVRFHGGRRVSFFRCKGRHEGMWIAHKLAGAMDLPESAIHH
jgi:hypothetical protein